MLNEVTLIVTDDELIAIVGKHYEALFGNSVKLGSIDWVNSTDDTPEGWSLWFEKRSNASEKGDV